MKSVAAILQRVKERRNRLSGRAFPDTFARGDRAIERSSIEFPSRTRSLGSPFRRFFTRQSAIDKEHEDLRLRTRSRSSRPAIAIGAGIILTFVMIQSAFGYAISFQPGDVFGGSIGEGETKTLTMIVWGSKGERVAFRLTSTDPDTLRVNTPNVSMYLSFVFGTGGSYRGTASISLTAPHDGDNNNHSVTIQITNDKNGERPDKIFRVNDDDSAAATGTIQITPAGNLSVTEESSATFSVRLSAAANGPVTITPSTTSGPLTVSPSSLSFSPSDWNTAKTVTVTAAGDDDASDTSGSVSFSAKGGFIAPDVTKRVDITDDDEVGFDITPTTLTIDEGGEKRNFAVRPLTRPSTTITVTVSTTNSDLTIDTDPGTAGAQSTLTFARFGQTNAWNQYKGVTVAASHDSDDDDESYSVFLTGSGGDYQGASGSLTIEVDDDDKPSGTIDVTPAGTLDIDEGGSGTLSVKLSTAPSANVTVSLSKTNSDVSLSPPFLSFTTSNWSVARTVTVSAGHDIEAINDTDTITLSASGGIIASNVTKAVYITDDETPLGTIDVSPSGTLTVDEGDSTGVSLSVKLNVAPTSDATVTLTKTSADVNLSSTSLTFTASNFSTAQTVTLTAVEDADTIYETDTITLSASGGISASNVTRSVTVIDNDIPSGTIMVSPSGTLNIDEGDSAGGDLSVRLGIAPNADVTVSLAKTNSDVSLSKTSLTFTASNFSTAQTVTVTAADDGDAINETDTITLSGSGGIYVPNVTKAVYITDDETPSGTIDVSPSGTLSIDEGDSTGVSLSVKLSVAPTSDATVTLTKTSADVSLSSTSLTFTASNFSTAQTVTLTAVDDMDTIHETDTITLPRSMIWIPSTRPTRSP